MDIPSAVFYTRADLASIGVTDVEIKSAIRRGSIIRVARGAYADAAMYSAMIPAERHILAIRATARGRTVSHQSAAVLHGLQMWAPDLGRVHVSVNAGQGGRRTDRSHVHTNRVAADSVTTVDGLTVTTVTRTAVDLARSLSFEAAVCVVDSALASGGTTVELLRSAVDTCAGLAGCSAARRVVEFADGRSESVGESRSRVYLQRYGFPAPELQVTLRHGGLTARPDFLIGGVIIEFDGKLKYTSERALFEEKKRQDQLMSLGWVMARLTWEDLASDAGARIVRRALERAEGLPEPLTVRGR
ncbi:type IV toxin-antitoxin system AbiEi family antitoxin domain-containing protein [Rhodococcus sp. NBC_00297]|uniref:type IV toxin-antitoxin system AbiEi family antitoxin domain-containing protein n=1 Tax=Rhodococcus sp. NBC_00297 TaxID=2976005 RepID=UPI002E29F295|nr:type IV toxin-antitoxin system AbiEi family antitoxin domain-containing protein [Rhodococcus sp. NBC_00297]